MGSLTGESRGDRLFSPHNGLLKASYIPEVTQRDLRELTRYRTKLVQERTREINRVSKVLEDANIKLGSVASNVLGDSGREMIEQMIAGQDDPVQLAQLARGRLRRKITELEKALVGRMRETHRLLLRLHLEHVDDLNAKISALDDEIDRLVAAFDTAQALERLEYVLKTGCAWEDLPAEYGSDTTCWRRLNEWSQAGTWEHIWRTFLSQLDAQEKLAWAQAFLDGSFVPAKKGAME